MDSPALISQRVLSHVLPMWAVFVDDLRQTIRHWAFATWGIFALFLTIVWFIGVSGRPAPAPTSDASLVSAAEGTATAPLGPTAAEFSSRVLRLHLLLMMTFVIAAGASAICSEAGLLADAILCRGISRWQYFLGKCSARVAALVILFFLLALPAFALAASRLRNDLTWDGMTGALRQAGIVIAAVVVLSVAVGSWFRTSLAAVAVAWMLVYGLGIVVTILEIGELSPLAYVDRFVPILRGSLEGLPPHHLPLAAVSGAALLALVSLWGFHRRDL